MAKKNSEKRDEEVSDHRRETVKCKYECPEVEIVETLNFSEIMRAEFECIEEEKIRHGEGEDNHEQNIGEIGDRS